jgi:hypothetical protein
MCQRTTCRSCGKPTYVGCGLHVEQVLGEVPVSGRCACEPRSGGLFARLGSLFKSR